MLKSMLKVAMTAAVLFGINGWINFTLMKPLEGGADSLSLFRYRLDDAVFILLFGFIAVVFWAMFAVLPRERGYFYLGTISILTSLLLFWEWDEKEMLFGPFPEIQYGSLVIKSGITSLSFSLAAFLLKTANKPIARVLLWAGAMLWATIAAALLLSMGDYSLMVLNRLFLVHVFLNTAFFIGQFLSLFHAKERQSELRFISTGFVLFAIVLLPDLLKDLLEDIEGRRLGYRMVYWEQCLEDTFPWALLSLLTVFGVVFFRRFVCTIKDNEVISGELRMKNAALEQEIDTRQRLDQLLSVLLRAYRIADLEQSIIREGQRYFQPHPFVLVKYDETKGCVGFEGAGETSPNKEDIGDALRKAGSRLSPGEAIDTSSMILGVAGGSDGMRLFLAVYCAEGGPIVIEERNRFALLLMSKYVSIFYEYFHLLEGRWNEMEQRQIDRAPWLSKLFMQIAEKERKRLASDLHDEVLQQLLHIRRMLDRTPEDKEQIKIGLENTEFMIRETCHELMPPFLSDHGVLHAIYKLVEKTRLRADFQLDFHALPLEASLNDEQMTAIYRIVQELVSNAMKHSEAGRVTLEVGQKEGTLHIRYTDDGKGMDTDMDFYSANRFGLRGIAERIRMIGGEISVHSRPGQGVRIHCFVPV